MSLCTELCTSLMINSAASYEGSIEDGTEVAAFELAVV